MAKRKTAPAAAAENTRPYICDRKNCPGAVDLDETRADRGYVCRTCGAVIIPSKGGA